MTLRCSETPGGGHCGQDQRRHPPLSQPHMPGSGRAHTADQLEAQRHPHCGRLGRKSELSAPRGFAGEVCDEERRRYDVVQGQPCLTGDTSWPDSVDSMQIFSSVCFAFHNLII